MSQAEALRRLGGGRWKSRDGRFTIEPQSGTWVVLDTQQTDDLGLPLVRGPFRSLAAAREAMDAARDEGPPASPLASRLEQAKGRSKGGGARPAGRKPPERKRPPARSRQKAEPAWLGALDPGRGRRARDLIGRLVKAGIDGADEIARAEIADDEPALARLAIERRVRAALEAAKDPEALARALARILVAGEDGSLEARWRLVDGAGRPIASLDVSREKP